MVLCEQGVADGLHALSPEKKQKKKNNLQKTALLCQN